MTSLAAGEGPPCRPAHAENADAAGQPTRGRAKARPQSGGALLVRAAALCLALNGVLAAQRTEAETGRLIGVAPIEQDLEAMRSTLRAFEDAVNARNAEAVEPLISPRLSPRRRREIVESVEEGIRALPPGSGFALRSDIGPGALVPVGPERVHVQTTQILSLEQGDRTGPLHFELEAVEEAGARRWLLVDIRFRGEDVPGTGSARGPWIFCSIAAGGVVAAALIAALVVRSRRAGRKRARPLPPPRPRLT